MGRTTDINCNRGSTSIALIEASETRHRELPRRARGETVDQRWRWINLLSELADPSVMRDELAIHQALRGLAEATVRARANDLECFARFCHSMQCDALPATSATIVAYLDQLSYRGQKVTTIERKLSSIAAAHRFLGLENPCRAAVVRSAVRAIGRANGVDRRQALAVCLGEPDATVGADRITLHALLDGCTDDPRGLRDAALLSVAYDGGLRASEVIRAAVEDLDALADGSGTLTIHSGKPDQEGEGALVYLSPDTMQRLSRWLAVAEISTGTLFRRVERRSAEVRHGRAARSDVKLLGAGKFVIVESPAIPTVRNVVYTIEREDPSAPGGARLSRQGLAKIYRSAARRAADSGHIALSGAKLEECIAAFSTGGFRVGLTQDLFAEQFDVGQIQHAMRWKSPTTALGYACKLASSSNAAAVFLKGRRPTRVDKE